MTKQEAITWLSQLSAGIEWELDMNYAVAIDMAIEALNTKQMGGDFISRQAAIDAVTQYCIDAYIEDGDYHASGMEYELNNLPAAQSERKKGKWVYYPQASGTGVSFAVYLLPVCSECGKEHPVANFCPNCGARVTPLDETVLLNTESPVEGVGGPAEEKLSAAAEPASAIPAQQAAPQQAAPQAPRPQQAPQYAQPNYQAAPQYGYAPQQPSNTNYYYGAPVTRAVTESDLPEQYKPIKAWGYFGYTLLFSIPVVGLIFLIVFSCSRANINRRNFARSFWCWLIIVAVLLVVLLILVAAGYAHVEWPSFN